MFAIICEVLLAFTCPIRDADHCMMMTSLMSYDADMEDPCISHNCQYGATCVGNYLTGRTDCVCPATCKGFPNTDMRPTVYVCGSDNITYDSHCQLRFASCKQQRPIDVESIGVCGGCQKKQCDFYSTCEVDSRAAPVCACPSSCAAIHKPVCGVDGITYENECELRRTACEQRRFIVVAAPYPCEALPTNAPSTSLDYEPDPDPDDDSDGSGFGSGQSPETTEVDILPCYGSKPLQNNVTHEDLYCGQGNQRKCPVGTYCHQSIIGGFAKCCPEEKGTKADCTKSEFGCCPDGITMAKGRNGYGCGKSFTPFDEVCKCNKIGSYSTNCDEESKQCTCRLGVGGNRCDRCQPGFWGLKRAVSVRQGCIPCSCSNFGSVRPDCEQMTGRCVCKPGVLGPKCDKCADGAILQPAGCVSADAYPMEPSSCGELLCHLGAICVERNGHVECVCNMTCKEHEPLQVVCGSDGRTYNSLCQLRIHACKLQKDITIKTWGSCAEAGHSFVTVTPLTGTPFQADMKSVQKADDVLNHIVVRDGDVHSNELPLPRKITGYLGDSCDRDIDCTVKYSSCPRGKCTCYEGYEPSIDLQNCKMRKPLVRTLACNKRPCHNGGTCLEPASEDQNTNGYTCSCPPGYQGKTCEEATLSTVPSFGGKSFFELRSMSGYTHMTIEMEFQPHELDGILLYNGQKADGSGDFISLSLNNGFVEFRYDLGDGSTLIRSNVQITLEKRHRIIAKRFNQDGMLRLDDSGDVLGKSPGTRKFLDLEESLFIGYVPTTSTMIFDKIGTKSGFIGCIFSLKVGKRFLGLTDPGFQDTIAAFEIGECGENVCASSPCQNQGICQASSKSHQYVCTCPVGYSGHQCEMAEALIQTPCKNCQTGSFHVDENRNGSYVFVCPDGSHGYNCETKDSRTPFIADFHGSSFIQLSRITDANPHLNIELWFQSRAESGLLLYAGRLVTGEGDFISLGLRQSRLEFLFDLGDGAVNITYPEEVRLRQWHTAKVFRHGKRVSLQLDAGPVISAESQGLLAELNLELGTFIGGVRNVSHTAKPAKVSKFLDGALQMVNINGKQWDNLWKEAVEMHQIRPYEGAPCQRDGQQCYNGGLCIPRLSSFRCKCPPNYWGERCEKAVPKKHIHDAPVHFDGHTLLEYHNMITRSLESQEKNFYRFRLRTKASNGLLIWQSKGKNIRGDYLSVAVVDGRVEVSYDLGKEQDMFVITSVDPVNDGRWHMVTVERSKRLGTLQVDDESPQSGTSTSGTTVLNSNGKLYIGGSTELPAGFPTSYYQGFDGCLADFHVEQERVYFSNESTNGLELCSYDTPER